jgi:hypothetical protein
MEGIMRKKSIIAGIVLVILMSFVGFTAGAVNTTSSTSSTADPTSLVFVSSVSMDPEVFYPYEEGTITITLVNKGDTAVGLVNPEILSKNVHITSEDAWNTVTYIGPGTETTYTFPIAVVPPEGTYFPLFSLGTKSGLSIHYPFTVKIDSTDLKAVISGEPDAFAPSTKETVNLTLINPRSGALDDILISAFGSGLEISPSQKYISNLGGQSSTVIPFSVTAAKDSSLTFNVSYRNGESKHAVDLVMPITIGEDKTAAVPIVNNVALTQKGSYYDLTGDITNAGITDANGLVVTTGPPAQGTGTYPEYVIGSLASDDSSSFDVTFTATDLSSLPLVITWKNEEGDDYKVTKVLNLNSASGSANTAAGTGSGTASGSSTVQAGGPGGAPPGMGGPGGSTSLFSGSKGNGISSFYPVIAAGILVVAGIVLWTKRKWLSAKLKKK